MNGGQQLGYFVLIPRSLDSFNSCEECHAKKKSKHYYLFVSPLGALPVDRLISKRLVHLFRYFLPLMHITSIIGSSAEICAHMMESL